MSNKKKNQNNADQNTQQNTGNGKETKAKKPGLKARLENAKIKHPKTYKIVTGTAKAVVLTLAAVGGTGLGMAIEDRRKKPASPLPTLPDIPAPAVPAATEDQTE